MAQDGRLSDLGRRVSAAIPRAPALHGLLTRVHRGVYRLSGGRIGASLGGAAMLLLTTTGRRSGEPREVPLLTFRDGDDWIVVGSNFGKPHDPAWVLNVRADSNVHVRIGRESHPATASVVTGPEHDRLWARALEVNDQFSTYAETSGDRDITIVRLRNLISTRGRR